MSAYMAVSGEYPMIQSSRRRRDTTRQDDQRPEYRTLWIIAGTAAAVGILAFTIYPFVAILEAHEVWRTLLLVAMVAGFASATIAATAAVATRVACTHMDRRAAALRQDMADDLAGQQPRYAALAAIPGDVRAQVEKLHRMYARELERLEGKVDHVAEQMDDMTAVAEALGRKRHNSAVRQLHPNGSGPR